MQLAFDAGNLYEGDRKGINAVSYCLWHFPISPYFSLSLPARVYLFLRMNRSEFSRENRCREFNGPSTTNQQQFCMCVHHRLLFLMQGSKVLLKFPSVACFILVYGFSFSFFLPYMITITVENYKASFSATDTHTHNQTPHSISIFHQCFLLLLFFFARVFVIWKIETKRNVSNTIKKPKPLLIFTIWH